MKARLIWAKNDDVVMKEMVEGFSLEKPWKTGGYEPSLLFDGQLKIGNGNAEEIGKRLVKGQSGYQIARDMGVCWKTVAKVKRLILEHRGAYG